MQRQSKHRIRERTRRVRGKRGVSDVLGTILILALTVTLFSSIFFFVNTFPKPATQPASQFQGELYYTYTTKGTHEWTNVSFLTITHLGGPAIYNFNTQIYVVSQAHPQNTTTTYTIGSGIPGSTPTTSWGTGQVWNLSLAGDHLTIPDNITVTVVSAGTVVYRQTLPGSNPTIPPIFDNEGTFPANPVVSSTFSVWVQITDPFLRTTSKQVYLNLTTPGLTCTNPGDAANMTTKVQMQYNSTNGLWFVGGCETSTSGTYYITAWATDSNPIQTQQNSIIFPIAVSTTSSSSGSSLVVLSILTNTSVPVIGQPLSVVVDVTNNGAAAGTATVYFGPTAGFSPTSSSGTVAAGATVGFQATYTPSASGALLLNSSASIPGIGAGTATLALTVYPHILFIAENVPAATVPTRTNESANLANELVSAGFPFTTYFVSCTAASYPKAITSQFTSGAVAIIDFGTNTSQSTCVSPNYNATTDVAYQIYSGFSNGTSFWVVGSRAFTQVAAGCENADYRDFLQIFGLAASATSCGIAAAALSTSAANPVYYSSSTTLNAAGISSPIYANGNLTGLAGFTPYKTLTLSTTAGTNEGTAFLRITSTTGSIIGAYYTGSKASAVATSTDPVLFGDTPVPSSWNGIGAEVAYNVVNFLAKLSTTTGPSRAGVDFGVAGALITGSLSHTTYNTIYVNLRANDATEGILTVTMMVNGAAAVYQGTIVSATIVQAGNGGNTWVALTWQAPAAGTYVFSFVLATSPADGFLLNNQYNYYLTGAGITFT